MSKRRHWFLISLATVVYFTTVATVIAAVVTHR
jgi:hypothetical protein